MSATILRNEVTESPGRAAACAAPFRIGEVMFIAYLAGAQCRFGTEIDWNYRGLVTATAIVVQRAQGAIYCQGAARSL